jgi:hypothetical protein
MTTLLLLLTWSCHQFFSAAAVVASRRQLPLCTHLLNVVVCECCIPFHPENHRNSEEKKEKKHTHTRTNKTLQARSHSSMSAAAASRRCACHVIQQYQQQTNKQEKMDSINILSKTKIICGKNSLKQVRQQGPGPRVMDSAAILER